MKRTPRPNGVAGLDDSDGVPGERERLVVLEQVLAGVEVPPLVVVVLVAVLPVVGGQVGGFEFAAVLRNRRFLMGCENRGAIFERRNRPVPGP